MDLPENLLVKYAEEVEKYITMLPVHTRAATNFNFKNCTVNIRLKSFDTDCFYNAGYRY
jgi:hypothetical protein